MSKYRKAIAAAAVAAGILVDAVADGNVSPTEIKAIGAAWIAAVVVFLIPNDPA